MVKLFALSSGLPMLKSLLMLKKTAPLCHPTAGSILDVCILHISL